jgi:hypothetical protein
MSGSQRTLLSDGQEETHMAEEDAHMADVTSDSDKGNDTGVRPDHGSTYSTPRWVKAFGIILIVVLVLVFLVQHLVFEGVGGHMP